MQLATVTATSPLTIRQAGDTVDVPATSMGVRVVTGDQVLVENIDNTILILAGSRHPTPPGVIDEFGGATPPDGWLLCNGAAVSRTTYADLFAAIGTTWGTGDGSTTFNVPDGRGRVLVGVGTFATLGETDGLAEASRTLQHIHPVPNEAAHSHSISNVAHTGTNNATGSNSGGVVNKVLSIDGAAQGNHNHGGNTGNGGAHDHGGNTGQNTATSLPFAGVNYMIRT